MEVKGAKKIANIIVRGEVRQNLGERQPALLRFLNGRDQRVSVALVGLFRRHEGGKTETGVSSLSRPRSLPGRECTFP